MFALLRRSSRIAENHVECIMAKRNAGHSKWQNTRHIKEQKNKEKSAINVEIWRRMRSAVYEQGGSTDPKDNFALQSAINAAAKANVPKETWMKYLQKLQTGEEEMFHLWLTGPQRSVLRLTFSCLEISLTRQKVKSLCKKTCFVRGEENNHVFKDKGHILARLPSTVAKHTEAEEAAINAGAEEVEPYENDEGVFQFTTSAEDLNVVTKGLRSAGWEVLKSSVCQEVVLPAELSEQEVELVSKDLQRFIELPEYVDMIDNISLPRTKVE